MIHVFRNNIHGVGQIVNLTKLAVNGSLMDCKFLILCFDHIYFIYLCDHCCQVTLLPGYIVMSSCYVFNTILTQFFLKKSCVMKLGADLLLLP